MKKCRLHERAARPAYPSVGFDVSDLLPGTYVCAVRRSHQVIPLGKIVKQ